MIWIPFDSSSFFIKHLLLHKIYIQNIVGIKRSLVKFCRPYGLCYKYFIYFSHVSQFLWHRQCYQTAVFALPLVTCLDRMPFITSLWNRIYFFSSPFTNLRIKSDYLKYCEYSRNYSKLVIVLKKNTVKKMSGQ